MKNRLHAPHLAYPPHTEPPTPENILYDLFVHDGDEKFYIQWEGEKLAEGPAWILFNPYSIGAVHKKWTVYFGMMAKTEYKTKTEARKAIKTIFETKSKEKGKLWLQEGNSINLKLFTISEGNKK